MQEELGAEIEIEIEIGEVLTVVENRYQLNGGSGHEFVIAREARFRPINLFNRRVYDC